MYTEEEHRLNNIFHGLGFIMFCISEYFLHKRDLTKNKISIISIISMSTLGAIYFYKAYNDNYENNIFYVVLLILLIFSYSIYLLKINQSILSFFNNLIKKLNW